MREDPGSRSPVNPRPLSELRDLKPEERTRIGRAVVVLLGWGLVATALLGLITLWHLVRRGRALRANLANPRAVSLPEVERRPPPRSDPLD